MTAELKREMLRLLKDDEEFRYTVAGYIGLEEILKRLDRHEAEMVRLREDMVSLGKEVTRLREDLNHGFQLIERHISALGARWGIESEEAFREGLRGLLQKELGFKVKKWEAYDDEGFVFGYPSQIEVDVVLHDDKTILIEVMSHARSSDLYLLKRKSQLYEKKTGKKPSRLVIVTPYADESVEESSKQLEIEIYSKV